MSSDLSAPLPATPLVPAQAEAPSPKIKRGGRQQRFLAQSVILEETGSPGLVRAALYTVSVVTLAFTLWASVVEVSEVASAFGQIVPTGQVQSVQHLEGGIIKDLLVRDGDLVAQGQVLIRLDSSSASAEFEQMKARAAALELQSERLRAFGAGRQPDFSRVPPEYLAMVRDQQTIFDVQEVARTNQLNVLRDQVSQRRSEIAVIDEQTSTLRKQVAILSEDVAMRESLFQKGLSSKVQFNDAKRQLNQASGDLGKAVNDRQRASKALAEVESRLIETDSRLKQEALSQMGQVASELAQVKESLTKLADRSNRLEIKAPVRGIVKGLKNSTVGGVLAPGAVVLDVVPLDQELVVEAKINTKDVGHVRVGQPVTVKVITYDFSRYGAITGEVKSISATTFLDEKDGSPYYKGVVSIDRNYVGFDPERNRVLPGMTVQADVNTGTKTLIQYFLKPIYTSLTQAFRER